MSKARERARSRTRHQLTLLADLKARSYTDLAALPSHSQLHSPFPGIAFRLERSDGAKGGVQIEVVTSERSFLIFEHRIALGFEMLPDGRVIDLQEVRDED